MAYFGELYIMTKEEIRKKLKDKFQIDGFGKNIFGDITFSLSPSDPNYKKDVKRYVAVEKFKGGGGGEIIITVEWNKIQPANIEEIEDNLIDIVNAKGIKEVKAITKEIRTNATKLSKKKLRLEDVETDNKRIRKIKDRLQVKNVFQDKWDNIRFELMQVDPNYNTKFNKFITHYDHDDEMFSIAIMDVDNDVDYSFKPELENIENRIEDILNTKDIKDVENKTKEIKSTAKKLPKKTMKLKEWIDG